MEGPGYGEGALVSDGHSCSGRGQLPLPQRVSDLLACGLVTNKPRSTRAPGSGTGVLLGRGDASGRLGWPARPRTPEGLPSPAECHTLNGLVSEVFIRFFVEAVGHYSLFLTQTEKGERAFQREAFRKSVASKSIRRFLEVFMESQMFAGFIQDRELRKCRAKGKAS